MRWMSFAVFGGLALALSPARAAVVVELFTSQSCSSCPPADALLAELQRTHPEVLPLDFHVDYWDHLGWRDPYSSVAATLRQRRYAERLGVDGVYTPQMVISGAHQAVGSDRAAVLEAIRTAAAADAVPVELSRGPNGLMARIGAGGGSGTLVLIGYDSGHTTQVGGGENAGRTLTEINVVRSIAEIGPWRGAAVEIPVAAPEGQLAAVLLHAEDGRILGAATAGPEG